MIKNIIFTLIAVLSLQAGYASEKKPNLDTIDVCLYESKKYTPGSIIQMMGITKICRNSSYEFKQLQAEGLKQDKKIYIPPSLMGQVVAWRKLIPIKYENNEEEGY